MQVRVRLFAVSMWWAVIGSSIWIGGTLFMMLVINPQWSGNPPESVRYFFTHTGFTKYITTFFGPPFMLLRSFVPQAFALVFGWPEKRHRKYLLATIGCTVATIMFTLIYIYPINEELMFKAGGNNSPEMIQRMTQQWLLSDRIRFAVNVAGYFFLIKAFRLPQEELK